MRCRVARDRDRQQAEGRAHHDQRRHDLAQVGTSDGPKTWRSPIAINPPSDLVTVKCSNPPGL